jgi:cytochrome c
MSRRPIHELTVLAMLAGSLLFAGAASAAGPVDVDAAKALAKQSNCFKCHSVDKEKDGPTWRSVAEKYRNKPDAERMERLTTHITSGEMVKFQDGHQEHHTIVKTKDPAQISNLVRYILSL